LDVGDVDPLRRRVADAVVDRLVSRASAGDILVMHDGDEQAPYKPQPVDATARLIPALRARGLPFGTVRR
jgi:peptidoglycan/xylan/chitin deacetylase (PgdA/CDA1 family)